MNHLDHRNDASNSRLSRQDIAATLFCIICAVFIFYVLIKYALIILLPFIISWALSMIIEPLSVRLSKRLPLSKRAASCFLMILLLSLILSLLMLAIDRVVYEGEKLLEWLASDSARLGSAIAEFFNKITSFNDKPIPLIESLMKIEQFRQLWENIDVIISDMISGAASSLTRAIPTAIIQIIGKLPSIALFVIITVISCIHFALDTDKINSAIVSLLPMRLKARLPELKKRLLGTAAKYIRAYLLLLFLTFCELFVGFSLLNISYPLLLAMLIALIDIMPVLGVGTAIIPWGMAELLLFKDHYTGIGLLIIYAVVTVMRQITEPRIVAGSLGLHPLITLASMYIGFKVFGLAGMIIGPVCALALRSLLKRSSTHSEMSDAKVDITEAM